MSAPGGSNRRIAAAVVGALLVATLAGCGRLFPSYEPEASLSPPPGRYDESIRVYASADSGERVYWSTDPRASFDEFEPSPDVYVASDTTFRYYTIDARGIRSAIVEAEYLIDDDGAPVIDPPNLFGANARYYRFDLFWETVAPWETEDGRSNPFDEVTDWEYLEYAVYSSAADDIGSLSAAKSNGRLEMGWLTRDENDERSAFRYFASRPGEARYFNVFVRDAEGNASGYGARRFATRPALSVYVGENDTTTDKVWLHDTVSQTYPSFTATTRAFADEYVKAIDLGRIDGDLFEDLAVVRGNGTQDFYRWYRAQGDGTFDEAAPAAEVHVESNSPNPRAIRIADMTGDAVPELVYNTGARHIRVSTITESLLADFAADAEGFAIGDIDNDGLNDIVSGGAAPGLQNVRVWRNDGGAAFVEVTQPWSGASPPVPGSGAPPADLNLVDLDQDGNLDLVMAVASMGPPSVELAWGQGDGTFVEESAEALYWGTDKDTHDVAVADFDRDGDPDLFFSNAVAPSRVWLNDGDRTFSDDGFDTGSSAALQGAIAADMNGDGWPDVLENHGSGIQVWINMGDGTFDPLVPVFSANTPRFFAVGQIR